MRAQSRPEKPLSAIVMVRRRGKIGLEQEIERPVPGLHCLPRQILIAVFGRTKEAERPK